MISELIASPPRAQLRTVVVVPAHNEEDRIEACLEALANQHEVEPDSFEVIVVLDNCSDGTEHALASASARWPRLHLTTIEGPGRGAGPARAAGMDLACARLESTGRPDCLLATTDADSVVAPDWIARQIEAIDAGAEAIGGNIRLQEDEAILLPVDVLNARDSRLETRTRLANERGPSDHAHFAGASIGLTPRAYRLAGGMGDLESLEDQEFEDRLAQVDVPIHRPDPVRVVTSARTEGRAVRGLALDLAVASWNRTNCFSGGDYTLEELLAMKNCSVAVILPAREVASTIGMILGKLRPLEDAGLIDEVLVVDADSRDGTHQIARNFGAEVVDESTLNPELGPCLGKGDAMYRAARAVESDLLVFLDADTTDFTETLLTGLLGPVFSNPKLALVKGAFERPLERGGSFTDGEGGRVTELVARPLLNLHFPALAGFTQPLAGEFAIRRETFLSLSVPVSYGVEIAMLIDCLELVGLEALAQSNLGTRQNRHQSLRDLSAMATQIMVAVEKRTGGPRRPDSVRFSPRAETRGDFDHWQLRCEERSPTG